MGDIHYDIFKFMNEHGGTPEMDEPGKTKSVREALQDSMKKQETGWISVKDRPPENGWWMVSLVNNRTGHRWEVPVIAELYKGEWDFCKIFSNNPNATVTHYMPLPKPPEEVSEDGQR